MSVHYKFKNTINYEPVKFDGVYISTSDLKTIIAQQKKLGNSELQISNEETKEIYSDDQMIPKNTNVIVLRLPHANSNKRARSQHNNNQHLNHTNNNHNNNNNRGTLQGSSSSSGSTAAAYGGSSMNSSGIGGGREALEIVSNKNMTEEERLKYIQSQSTRDFDPSRYARGGRGGRGSARGGQHRHHAPRPGYTCIKCGIPGHFVHDCKSAVHKVKRSSGIPRDFLMKVDSKEKGALMTPTGEFAVPIIDREAYSKPKVERAPFFEDGTPDDVVEHESDLEQVAKKAKLGFAIPNWKNISTSNQPDADRYADYAMVLIRSNCEALVATYERKLLDMPMYAISTNVLCRHTKNGQDIYIPIEIGIHCYSLAGGHQGKTYHCMVDAGPIPTGCVNQTRDHTESTHKICNSSRGEYPIEARKDYMNIYKEMLKYVRGGQRTVLVPDKRDMDQVKGCLEWLHERASIVDPALPKVSTWTILPMVEYVAAAYNFVHQRILHQPEPVFTIHYVIKLKQEDSTWDYEEQYTCSYHRKYDNQTKWCAKNCAARAFLAIEQILDTLSGTYKAATQPAPSLITSQSSSVSSRSMNHNQIDYK